MKPSKREFVIPFLGLKLGKHKFDYVIKDTFFEQLDYSPIHQGDLRVELELEKKETMMVANFKAKGNVSTNCDRCDTPMNLMIDGELELIYKFGDEESEDENLIVLFPEEYEIDIKDPIYQMIILALPQRKIHAAGECDEEMWELIQRYTVNTDFSDDEDEDDDEEDDENERLGIDEFDINDPRWSKLKIKK
jgi:uncharacterized metal-binding protein YceD (DUF177 family)